MNNHYKYQLDLLYDLSAKKPSLKENNQISTSSKR